jgi:aryl-alcohol dehydrogenase-like predicted oxidoreductase
MKLCLGTVQFGLDYGIKNKQGKIKRRDVVDILNYAYSNNLTMLDTASAYGTSETVLGDAIKKVDKPFSIITKYPANASVRPLLWIDISLERLKTERIYGYLFHNYSIFQEHPDYIDDFVKIKTDGKAAKIGFSLYYPSEIEYILKNNIPCDIVQVPYNILDQRFAEFFPEIKKRNIEIHVRSIFLQGLFFISPEKLDNQFYPVQNQLKKIHECTSQYGTTISSMCLGFVNANKNIDKIVIGVDSLDDLKNNIHNYLMLNINFSEFEKLSVTDENIILPFNWKK